MPHPIVFPRVRKNVKGEELEAISRGPEVNRLAKSAQVDEPSGLIPTAAVLPAQRVRKLLKWNGLRRRARDRRRMGFGVAERKGVRTR